MRKRAPVGWALGVAALAALAAMPGCSDDSEPGGPAEPLRVHVRNLYLGADFSGLFGLPTPADIPPEAGQIWADVQKSKPPERMQLVAAQIAASAPDVVALQEVSLFRRQIPSDWQPEQPSNATEVAFDFLALLQEGLADRGASYHVVASQENGDAELPALAEDGSLFDLRLTDRNVILVRDGLVAADAGGGVFPPNATLAFPVGGAGGTTLRLDRGWVSVDVALPGGKTVRVVNAHLEIGVIPSLQEAQALSLLSALDGQRTRTVLAGDFNSPANNSGTASYSMLTTSQYTQAPFRDAWSAGSGDGFTCCVRLDDPSDRADSRIDLVLFRGREISARSATVIGADPGMLTASGLRGSDHFGVEALLDVK